MNENDIMKKMDEIEDKLKIIKSKTAKLIDKEVIMLEDKKWKKKFDKLYKLDLTKAERTIERKKLVNEYKVKLLEDFNDNFEKLLILGNN